jgi:hypothetical protein
MFSIYGWILLTINILDLVSTVYILNNGGTEMNPFMNWFYIKLGMSGFVTMKMIIVFTAIYIFEYVWFYKIISRSRMKFYYILTIVGYIVLYSCITGYVNFLR